MINILENNEIILIHGNSKTYLSKDILTFLKHIPVKRFGLKFKEDKYVDKFAKFDYKAYKKELINKSLKEVFEEVKAPYIVYREDREVFEPSDGITTTEVELSFFELNLVQYNAVLTLI